MAGTPFAFAAIVAQDGLKLALTVCAVDPGSGGVLAFGDRGRGKSTAVRALAALLPPMRVIEAVGRTENEVVTEVCGVLVEQTRRALEPPEVRTQATPAESRPTPNQSQLIIETRRATRSRHAQRVKALASLNA